MLPTRWVWPRSSAAGPQHALRRTERSLSHWIRNTDPIFGASPACETLNSFGDDVIEAVTAVKQQRAPAFPSVASG